MAIFTFTLKEGQISLVFFLSFYIPHKNPKVNEGIFTFLSLGTFAKK